MVCFKLADSARKTAPSGADTLILAFSHKGRRDTLVAIRGWLRMAILVGLWIPAFAGMTVGGWGGSGEKRLMRA